MLDPQNTELIGRVGALIVQLLALAWAVSVCSAISRSDTWKKRWYRLFLVLLGLAGLLLFLLPPWQRSYADPARFGGSAKFAAAAADLVIALGPQVCGMMLLALTWWLWDGRRRTTTAIQNWRKTATPRKGPDGSLVGTVEIEARDVFEKYLAVMGAPSESVIRDAADLPYSKEIIKTVLRKYMKLAGKDQMEHLKVAYLTLADFQPLSQQERDALRAMNESVGGTDPNELRAKMGRLVSSGAVHAALMERWDAEWKSLSDELGQNSHHSEPLAKPYSNHPMVSLGGRAFVEAGQQGLARKSAEGKRPAAITKLSDLGKRTEEHD